MPKARDWTGKKVGELTVKTRLGRDIERPRAGVVWLCECDCGCEQLRTSDQLAASIRYGHCPACPRCLAEVRRGKRHIRREWRSQTFVSRYRDRENLYSMQEHERELAELRQEAGLPDAGPFEGLIDDPDVSTYAADIDWELENESSGPASGVSLSPYGESVSWEVEPATLDEVSDVVEPLEKPQGRRKNRGVTRNRVFQIQRKTMFKLSAHPILRELIGEGELMRRERNKALEQAIANAEEKQRQEEEWRRESRKYAAQLAKDKERLRQIEEQEAKLLQRCEEQEAMRKKLNIVHPDGVPGRSKIPSDRDHGL